MKKARLYLVLLIFTGIYSCAPKVSTRIDRSYPATNQQQKVIVFGLTQELPSEAEVVGEVKVGDSGFTTTCHYGLVLDEAMTAAKKAGGNAIKITEHKQPSLGSSCHRITAKILKIENVAAYDGQVSDSLNKGHYSFLHVYRYKGIGGAVKYNLYLGDSLLCKVKNNFKTSIRITNEGQDTLWAETETKEIVPISLKHGELYYLRCRVAMGVVAGRPKMELVDKQTGRSEFSSFNAKRNE